MSRQTYNGNTKISDKTDRQTLPIWIETSYTTGRHVCVVCSYKTSSCTKHGNTDPAQIYRYFDAEILMQQVDMCVLVEISYKTN